MTTAVRWTMAWTCYWAGHVTYLVVGYRLYSRLMVWSDWWQGDTEHGPWKPADDSF